MKRRKLMGFLAAGIMSLAVMGNTITVSAAGLRDIFDARFYADTYSDLKAAFGYDEEALYRHFIDHGLEEGRMMNPVLDVAAYRDSYEDLDEAFGDNWDAYVEHYFNFGINEKRGKGVLFDPTAYADAYTDIREAFGDDNLAIVKHYITFGKDEGRTEGTSGYYKDLAEQKQAQEIENARSKVDYAWEKLALARSAYEEAAEEYIDYVTAKRAGDSEEKARAAAAFKKSIAYYEEMREEVWNSTDGLDDEEIYELSTELHEVFYGTNEDLVWNQNLGLSINFIFTGLKASLVTE